MPSRFALTLYEVSTWIIPLILAITFHEAAHGFVAHLFGDDTAWRQGRVSFNPLSTSTRSARSCCRLCC